MKEKGRKGGLPILAGKGVMKVIRCEMMGMGVEVEDHVIILGKVVGLLMESKSDGAETADMADLGLMYVEKGYRSVGENISPEVGIKGNRGATMS